MKRLFDIFFSLIGIIILLPLFIIISIIIAFDSKGGIFYKQIRIGKDFKKFEILKFRTMYENSDKKGMLTVGAKDNRITKPGYYLRKYKLDEIPQLINVLKGEMSFVGPRPEVPKYVDLYDENQKKVLSVKPGITDYASIEFRNENELLAMSDNPELTYVKEIMPAKLKLNLKYIQDRNLIIDIKIIIRTIFKVLQ